MPKASRVKSESKAVLHPNSRKVWQKARKEHHESKKELRRNDSNIKLGAQGEKLKWFKDNLHILEAKDVYVKSDIKLLVEKYLARFDDEREQIDIINKMKGRHGRMHAAREDNIRFIEEKEKNELHTSGFSIPDLTCKANVEYFKNWNGELRYLSNIKTKTVKLEELQ